MIFPIAAILSLFFSPHGFADETSIVDASMQKCVHGLHPQPNAGPFSVFLFCDDALGSNIGIILTERGAGPGNLLLDHSTTWHTWDAVNRFWQDRIWAADVVNFAWSGSQRYLYVSTSGVYGDGGFFRIDLRDQTHQRLMPSRNGPYRSQLTGGYFTKILDIDRITGKITVELSLYGHKETHVATQVFPFE